MTCTTHHHACECREAKFKLLLNAAKFLAQSHEKCMELAVCADPDTDAKWVDWVHYSHAATREAAEVKRLWSELKWD